MSAPTRVAHGVRGAGAASGSAVVSDYRGLCARRYSSLVQRTSCTCSPRRSACVAGGDRPPSVAVMSMQCRCACGGSGRGFGDRLEVVGDLCRGGHFGDFAGDRPRGCALWRAVGQHCADGVADGVRVDFARVQDASGAGMPALSRTSTLSSGVVIAGEAGSACWPHDAPQASKRRNSSKQQPRSASRRQLQRMRTRRRGQPRPRGSPFLPRAAQSDRRLGRKAVRVASTSTSQSNSHDARRSGSRI
jgi:hypothetical protein